jgi:polar amino acid transport system substrate-binding protein
MKKIFALLLALCLFAGLSAALAEDAIVVGMELAYPPFEGKDDDGAPYGLSVDFCYAMGQYLGREVEIRNIQWDGLLPGLQTGGVDMIMSSMTITDERSEIVDFSVPYANAYLAILANADSPIEEAGDLNSSDMKVAVKIGSTGYFYAMENFPEAEIIGLSDETACVTEVSQGKADAFLYDQLTIYRNQLANPDTTKAIFIPFQDAENWGIAVQKGDAELLDDVNEFIEYYYSEGGFEELTQKHLSDEKAAFDEYGFLWFFDLAEEEQ